MKTKFTDEELMQFADKETTAERSMDILSVLLQGDEEAKELAKRIDVFIETRNALINTLLGEKK